jgi:general secretion pathway protein G
MLRQTPSTRPAATARRSSAGFTILEMIIVVAMIGILATLALPTLRHSPRRAQEAVLKNNLRALRDVINQHFADKGNYPPSLEALVEEGYLKTVPWDPMTKSNETWEVVYEEFDEDELPAETDLPEDGQPGIIDVFSGSPQVSLDGEPYNEW